MNTKKYQLKNGLTVLLHPSVKSPVVTVQMWVRTGSADEGKGEEGISHFIEHLVFKGTDKYKMGEIASLVEGSGGDLNAYTSFDQTVFHVTISKQFTDTAMDVISEMMGFPTFDASEVDNEREVVIEEIKRGQDSLGRRASQLMFKEVYKNHAYGIPVIGYDKVIKKVKLKKLTDYYHSRYVPQNMFLLISGDFEISEMKKKIDQSFSRFRSFKFRKVVRKKEPKQRAVRLKVEKSEFQQSVCYLTWRAVNHDHKDMPALSMLAFILGQGDSSRLVRKLRMEKAIANSAGSFAYSLKDDGVFAVSLGLQHENLEEAVQAVKLELARILSEPVSNEEMQKAINVFASEQYYSMESVDGLASTIGSWEFSAHNPDYQKEFLKQVESLTPSDLLKVARKYVVVETLTMTCLTNGDVAAAKKTLTSFSKDLKQTIASAKKEKPKIVKFKPVKFPKAGAKAAKTPKTEIKNVAGVKVFLRKQSETPSVTLKSAFMGGLRSETAKVQGCTEMLSRVWGNETKTYSEEEMSHKIDFMAASIGAYSGRNTFGMNADFLSPFTNDMMPIFGEVVSAPKISEELLSREKQVLINQIRSKADNPGQVCGAMFIQKMFAGHPYQWEPTGTEESITGLSVKDIEAYYKSLVSRKNMMICVVGDFDEDKILKQIEQSVKDLPAGQRFDKKMPIQGLEKSEVVYKQMNKEQSHLMVGYRGIALSDERRHTMQVMQSILSGMGGRLFHELREKNSLAYSVSPMRMDGLDGGYVGAYIGCSPEKVEKAYDMMLTEFNKLKTELVSLDELERAKRYIVGRHDIDLQRKSSICSTILFEEVYGMDSSDSLNISKLYAKITPEHIQQLAKEMFTGPKVISLVGPDTGAQKRLA